MIDSSTRVFGWLSALLWVSIFNSLTASPRFQDISYRGWVGKLWKGAVKIIFEGLIFQWPTIVCSATKSNYASVHKIKWRWSPHKWYKRWNLDNHSVIIVDLKRLTATLGESWVCLWEMYTIFMFDLQLMKITYYIWYGLEFLKLAKWGQILMPMASSFMQIMWPNFRKMLICSTFLMSRNWKQWVKWINFTRNCISFYCLTDRWINKPMDKSQASMCSPTHKVFKNSCLSP